MRPQAATDHPENLSESTGESGVCLVDSFRTFVEEVFFFIIEIEFNDLFDAVLAEDTWNTDAEVFFTVFAIEKG